MAPIIPAFGRWDRPADTEKFFSSQPNPLVRGASPAFFAEVDDNADVDLCALYEKVAGKIWDSLNQNPRGFCVGFGNAKIATLTVAMMVVGGEATWPGFDVAVEPIYGGMRFEIGAKEYGSDINRGGDGGVGSWAAEWLLKYGILLKTVYKSIDLTHYSEDRCDEMGRRGVPDELEPFAKEKPLKEATLCSDGSDCWRLIGGLHPLVHCSNQGFAMRRNGDGTCKATGSWAHCSGWSGRFTLKGGTRVLRYDNSWDGDGQGNGYLGEPITIDGANGPIHLNGCQFLVPLDVVDRMCRSGKETYAFLGVKGLTNRRALFLN